MSNVILWYKSSPSLHQDEILWCNKSEKLRKKRLSNFLVTYINRKLLCWWRALFPTSPMNTSDVWGLIHRCIKPCALFSLIYNINILLFQNVSIAFLAWQLISTQQPLAGPFAIPHSLYNMTYWCISFQTRCYLIDYWKYHVKHPQPVESYVNM